MVITKKKTIKNFPDITFVLRNFTLFHCPEACRFPLDAVNYMQLIYFNDFMDDNNNVQDNEIIGNNNILIFSPSSDTP